MESHVNRRDMPLKLLRGGGELPEDVLRRLAWTFLLSGVDKEKNVTMNKRLIRSIVVLLASITGIAGSAALIYGIWRYMNGGGDKKSTEKKSRRVCVVRHARIITFNIYTHTQTTHSNRSVPELREVPLLGLWNVRDFQLRYTKRKIILVVTRNRIRGK